MATVDVVPEQRDRGGPTSRARSSTSGSSPSTTSGIGIMYVCMALAFFVVAGLQASVMRWQLAVPDNTLVGPDTFNRLFTMHGTTMVFFVGMPLVFGTANYLVPLMIGARDVAFPRLNALSFWLSLFGGLLLYSSYLLGPGLYGAGSAPAVGWFAYAPLTEQPFTLGTSTDYWMLGLMVSGFGSIAGSINLIATIITMRCPGMTLGRMPMFVWLLLMAVCEVVLAMPVLTAAQVMLLFDRYLGAHFFDALAGGDPRSLAALLLVLRPPRGLHPHPPRLRDRLGNHSRLLPQGHLRVPGDGGRHPGHRLHRGQRVGAPHVHGGAGGPGQHPVRGHHHGHRRPHRASRSSTGWAPCGAAACASPRPCSSAPRSSFSSWLGGLTGVMLAVVPFDWQVSDSYFVVAHFHYVLIGGLVFLFFAAIYYWFPKATGRMLDERLGRWHFWLFVVGFNVTMGILHFAGLLGHAEADLHVSDRSRLGYHQPHRLSGRHPPGRGCPPVRHQHRRVAAPRRARRRRSLGRLDPGVGDHVAPAGVQLRDPPGRAESAAPLGSQASRRSGLEVRVTPGPARQTSPEWRLPSRGRAGMIGLIVMESAFLGTFVVAYLFYIGKSLSGPTPRQVLDFPLLNTVCLLASSVTVAIAVRALRRGRLTLFVAWLLVTILLGAEFLAGTAVEWYGLIVRDGLTIGTNLFGTTFYSLVGFHAGHVTLGLLLLILVWIFAVFGAVRAEHAERVELLSWYWHFVDAVWIVVLTAVYIVSR